MRTRRRRWVMLAVLGGLVLVLVAGWGAYAVVAWLRFGHSPASAGPDPLMQRYMPRYDIAEVHRTRAGARHRPGVARQVSPLLVDLLAGHPADPH